MEELRLIKLRDDLYTIEVGGKEIIQIFYHNSPRRKFKIKSNDEFWVEMEGEEK